ncbi:MAG: hypothetical protein ACI9KE_001103 [Polyangiales bacterium]|jgi:hypothetical protein
MSDGEAARAFRRKQTSADVDSTQQRTFEARDQGRKLKLLEFASFGVLALSLACWWLAVSFEPTCGPSNIGVTRARATTVRHAIILFRVEHPDAECPLVEELISGDYLDRRMRIEDAWENDFQIVCDGRAIQVDSAGPDQKFGTRDDVN